MIGLKYQIQRLRLANASPHVHIPPIGKLKFRNHDLRLAAALDAPNFKDFFHSEDSGVFAPRLRFIWETGRVA